MADISFNCGTSLLSSQEKHAQQEASVGFESGGQWIRTGLCAMIVLLAGHFSVAAGAETVTRRSTDKTVRGDVSEITRDSVSVKSRSKTVKIPASDVASIKWSNEPAKLNVIRSDDRRGRFEKALKGYEETLKSVKSPTAGLKTDLEYGIVYCTANLALQTTGEDAVAVSQLDAFLKANPQSYHYYSGLELMGRLAIHQHDWERAERSFTELAKSSAVVDKMAAKIGEGKIQLARDSGDTATAAADFEAVTKMDATSPREKAKQLEALSGLASCLIREKKFDEALEILDRVVSDASITDEAVLAEAYIQQGKCHMAAGQPKLAVLSLLHVDTLLFQAQGAHAETLYLLSRLWPQVGKPSRGDKDRMRLETLYPDSRWAKQLNGN